MVLFHALAHIRKQQKHIYITTGLVKGIFTQAYIAKSTMFNLLRFTTQVMITQAEVGRQNDLGPRDEKISCYGFLPPFQDDMRATGFLPDVFLKQDTALAVNECTGVWMFAKISNLKPNIHISTCIEDYRFTSKHKIYSSPDE